MREVVDDYEFFVGHVTEEVAKQRIGVDFMLPIPMLARVARRANIELQEVHLADVLWFYDQTVMTQKGK